MVIAPPKTGNDNSNKNEVIKTAHTNKGNLCIYKPGVLILKIVVIKLILPKIDAAPDKCRQKPHINYNLIPGVVYTWPEVAAVGKTEEELKAAGVDVKIGSFPIKALGRARASMDTQGVVKIIADASTDEVLGVHMVAPRAADLIMEAVTAMEYRASAEDMARICHPHPTYSEAVKEAALAATDDRALHV